MEPLLQEIHALQAIAQKCLQGAEENTMNFPEIVQTLMKAGFEGYMIDFRRATATYYLPSGESVQLSMHKVDAQIAPTFDSSTVQAAIREAQEQLPDYTYKNFCQKITKAGCAGYMVSFSGRRAHYFGRTAETHTEYFPS